MLVRDIEDVRHLIDVGRNFRDVDRKAEQVERMRDGEQNADAVLRVDLDDRKIVRRHIVDLNRRRYLGRALLEE